MAVIYLRSTDGNDSDDGSTWALAKATMAAAVTAAGAGGTVYVSQAHAEVNAAAAITIASPGTAGSLTRVICVNDGAAPPTALATTATVSTTGGTSGITPIQITGFIYVYGVTFRSSDGTATNPSCYLGTTLNTAHLVILESCKYAFISAASAANLNMGGNSGSGKDGKVVLINSSLEFNNAAQPLNVYSPLVWMGGSLTGIAKTTLFQIITGVAPFGRAELRGVDLSLIASGGSLVSVASNRYWPVIFESCKLGASVALTTGTHAGPGGVEATLVNCDSADTNYRYQYTDYYGSVYSETTIVRTGGATDGTTSFSRKITSSANTSFVSPIASPWVYFWDETVGSVTAAIEIVTDNVTLTNAEAWVEVEALTTSGFPLSAFANDRAADILATPANQTTSSETWTTTGLTTPVKQVLSKAVTTAEKGWIRCRVMLAKASTTLYACPKVKSTSQYQYMDGEGNIINGPAAGSSGGGPLIGGRLVR